jgi:pyruvate, water dikinase
MDLKEVSVDDKYIKWFSELNNKDIAIVGGKGASLGEMFNNKFPVPPGFVVTAQSFGMFIEQEGLKERIKNIVKDIDFENTEELTKASLEIRKLIESQEIPKGLKDEILEAYHILGSEEIEEKGISQDALNILKNAQEPIFVSVRSSATTEDLVDASFAGQQESFLNVKGDSRLIEHVKRCFSSLYTARAMYYRNKKGFKEGESLLAVVVQKMIDSEKSGVSFSRNPLTMGEEIVVEAVYGLGEGIVSGKIKPDHYIASRELKVEDVRVANKKIAIVRTGSGNNEIVRLNEERSKSQVLTNGEILEIADLSIKLEDHYQKPQDIEFALELGKVYIVQSRPITTKAPTEKHTQEISGTPILTGLGASPGIGVGTVKIIQGMEDLPKIKQGDVLVTTMTNPDMVVSMQKSAAIVTNEGGMTAHASIVSREMGIPAVVGTGEATEILKEGMKITVDGSNGKIYEGAVARAQVAEVKKAIEVSKVKLKLIVDLPEFAERAAESGIDSIGLTRLEGIIATMNKHPLLYEKEDRLEEYSELLVKGIEKISQPFKMMWIRNSDIRTDEYSTLKGAPDKEINPMLGLHGARFLLQHPRILNAELDAIKKVAEKYPDKKFGIMFPLVISINEVRELKKYFEEIKTSNMQFGIMIETPAAVQIIDEICKIGVDFISFGTNDLTQFTLAVDRGEDEVQYLYDESHPAVLSQIEKVIKSCKDHNVETSICGQAGSKPKMAEFLFKKGIDSISVNADAALTVSNLIKKLEDQGIKQENFETVEISDNSNDSNNVNINKTNENKIENIPPQEKKKSNRNVICASCGNETKLPFKPRKNKEYYCKNCFRNKNKTNNQEKKPKNEVKMPNLSTQKKLPDADNYPQNTDKSSNMLNKENVQIAAELEQINDAEDLEEDIGPVAPVGNLDSVQEKAEDILEQIDDFNDEELEEDEEIEGNIETSRQELSDKEKEGEKWGEKDNAILPETGEEGEEDFSKNEYPGFGEDYE